MELVNQSFRVYIERNIRGEDMSGNLLTEAPLSLKTRKGRTLSGIDRKSAHKKVHVENK